MVGIDTIISSSIPFLVFVSNLLLGIVIKGSQKKIGENSEDISKILDKISKHGERIGVVETEGKYRQLQINEIKTCITSIENQFKTQSESHGNMLAIMENLMDRIEVQTRLISKKTSEE